MKESKSGIERRFLSEAKNVLACGSDKYIVPSNKSFMRHRFTLANQIGHLERHKIIVDTSRFAFSLLGFKNIYDADVTTIAVHHEPRQRLFIAIIVEH
jgi:hypothetical protein